MQLITGGKGFIGLNTAQALLDLGESCVLTTSSERRALPDFIEKELGKRVFVERVETSDRNTILEIGKRHRITGIVHLAGAVLGRGTVPQTIEETQRTIEGWLNVLFAAQEWGVSRVGMASTIGVYEGVDDGPFLEDTFLPVTYTHPLPMSKKVMELIGLIAAGRGALQVINLRICGVWGPLSHSPPSPWNLPSQLVKAAVHGDSVVPSGAYAEEGSDSCYVKDCSRAIALLQLTPKLNHSTYNVGTGLAMKNKEIVAAIQKVIPSVNLELPAGFDPKGAGKNFFMDTKRLSEDTGFKPIFDVEKGVANYVAWLQAGNQY